MPRKKITGPKPPHVQSFMTYDIETTPIGKGDLTYIYGGTYDGYTTNYYDSAESLLYAILTSGYEVAWAHNGNEFDISFFVPYMHSLVQSGFLSKVDLIENGVGRMISLKAHIAGDKRIVTFNDSLCLIDMPLKDMARTLAKTQKLDIGLSNEENPETFDASNRLHVEYLRCDLVALYECLESIQTIMRENFQVYGLKPTIGALAMAAFKNMTTWDRPYINDHQLTAFRKSYRGGFVPLRSVKVHENCTTFDVNAMYAHAMRNLQVPMTRAVHCSRELDPLQFRGIYRCQVQCNPDDTPMTVLMTNQQGHSSAPYGAWEDWYTDIDIALARKYGYTISVIEGYVWSLDDCKPIFNDFVDTCERLEMGAKEREDWATVLVIKKLRNNLYGKFATHETHMNKVIARECPDGWKEVMNIDGSYTDMQYEIERKVILPYLMPHWASFITSMARTHLLNASYEIFEPKNVIYGDTDSSVVTAKGTENMIASGNVGDRYGQWKIEKHWIDFQAHAPKMYSGHILKDGEVVEFVKAKGIPSKLRTIANIEKHEQMIVKSSHNKMSRVIRDGVPMFRERKRSFTDIKNSKGWTALDDGTVIPVTLNA